MGWRIEEKSEGDRSTLGFVGELTEDSEFGNLHERLRRQVDFNLSQVSRINSCGVREWIRFMNRLQGKEVRFQECSVSMVDQMNMISNFRGAARIDSFFAPFICPTCQREQEVLLRTDQVKTQKTLVIPSVTCEVDGTELQFDDLEDVYFSFLSDMPGHG